MDKKGALKKSKVTLETIAATIADMHSEMRDRFEAVEAKLEKHDASHADHTRRLNLLQQDSDHARDKRLQLEVQVSNLQKRAGVR